MGSLGNTKIEAPTYGLKGKSGVQNGKFKYVANFNSKLPILQIVMIDFQSMFNDMSTARLPGGLIRQGLPQPLRFNN